MNNVDEYLDLSKRDEFTTESDAIIESTNQSSIKEPTCEEIVPKVGIKCAVKSCGNRRSQNMLDTFGNFLRWFSFPFEHKRL